MKKKVLKYKADFVYIGFGLWEYNKNLRHLKYWKKGLEKITKKIVERNPETAKLLASLGVIKTDTLDPIPD